MILVFDFKCEKCGNLEERFVDTREWRLGDAVHCSKCGGPAAALPATPHAKLDPFTGDFPSAADKWVKNRESHMKKERRNMENHGTPK